MQIHYNRDELIRLLPQQPPFLFLDTVELDGEEARAEYRVTGLEAVGHFAGNPVFPASLMMEALGQLACAWLLTRIGVERGDEARIRMRLLFVGVERIKIRRICTPGDVLLLTTRVEKMREPLAYFSGRILAGTEKTAVCESLALSFGEPRS
jgi:3-hydroxymyristoyl/3-hydroxydecanoyl-(acyl carrier protein) dehydratase